MKITNKNNLPIALVNAAQRYLNEYQRCGDVSVTELIDSPRISVLKRRHEDEIEVDISDCIWLLHGQLIHLLLEANADENTICEQRIIVPFDGWEISMKADFICKIEGTSPAEYCIHDWKDTKAYAWKIAPTHSHTAQNNIYRLGYRIASGLNCTQGQLDMLIKDFSTVEKMKHPREYPEREAVSVPVPAWDTAKTEAYLSERIAIHKHARTCTDDDLPECTLHERWGERDRFAVKTVDGGKVCERACPGGAGFNTADEARAWMKTKKTGKQYVVEFRPGENKRCDRNGCWVSRFCSFYNTKLNPAF
jgi:hypothetical protein